MNLAVLYLTSNCNPVGKKEVVSLTAWFWEKDISREKGGKKETEVWGKVCVHWVVRRNGRRRRRGKVAELSTDGRRTHFRVFCLRARRRQSTFCLRQYIRLYRIDKGDAFPIPKRLCKAPSDIVFGLNRVVDCCQPEAGYITGEHLIVCSHSHCDGSTSIIVTCHFVNTRWARGSVGQSVATGLVSCGTSHNVHVRTAFQPVIFLSVPFTLYCFSSSPYSVKSSAQAVGPWRRTEYARKFLFVISSRSVVLNASRLASDYAA